MTASVWQRLDIAGRGLAPVAVTTMLVLAESVPIRLPGYDRISPSLALMAVFYWAIHRPDLLRPSAAFLIGILEDLLGGTPLGLNALMLVIVHWVVVTQRSFFLANSFLMLWWGFALIMLGAVVLKWCIYSILLLDLMPLDSLVFQALLTLTLFPLLAWLFIRVHRAFLHQA